MVSGVESFVALRTSWPLPIAYCYVFFMHNTGMLYEAVLQTDHASAFV